MATMTVLFLQERETKGAVRYQEVDKDGNVLEITNSAKIGTLYVRKTAFAGVPPKALKIKIED